MGAQIGATRIVIGKIANGLLQTFRAGLIERHPSQRSANTRHHPVQGTGDLATIIILRQQGGKPEMALCCGISDSTRNLVFRDQATDPNTVFSNTPVVGKGNDRNVGGLGNFAGPADRFGKQRTKDHFRTGINRLACGILPALIGTRRIDRHQDKIIPGNVKHCKFGCMAHGTTKIGMLPGKRQQKRNPLFKDRGFVVIKGRKLDTLAFGKGGVTWPWIGIRDQPLIRRACRVDSGLIGCFDRGATLRTKQVRDTRGRITCGKPDREDNN